MLGNISHSIIELDFPECRKVYERDVNADLNIKKIAFKDSNDHSGGIHENIISPF
ncbi:MAG: hypothetical protein QME14_04075 [Methanobacteriaceae archaeon]|nr:hypothetical protein [Methanobacteriaceae archaeon]